MRFSAHNTDLWNLLSIYMLIPTTFLNRSRLRQASQDYQSLEYPCRRAGPTKLTRPLTMLAGMSDFKAQSLI